MLTDLEILQELFEDLLLGPFAVQVFGVLANVINAFQVIYSHLKQEGAKFKLVSNWFCKKVNSYFSIYSFVKFGESLFDQFEYIIIQFML